MVDNVRWKNTSDMNEYINGERTRQEEERLSRADQMAEFMFLGLRMMEGISIVT